MTKLPSKVGSYEFLTEPFHCDFEHHIFMGHLGNAMLNAADYHSNDRNFGMHYLNSVNKTWVLSRLAIEMDEMPSEYETITISTWVESAMRFFTSRNFQVDSADGHTLGYGRSIWAMIDTQTRQPTDILKIHDGLITEYIEKEKPCPISKPSRVVIGSGATLKRSLIAAYSDIDVNGHVNSVKYIDHTLDLWSLDWYRSHSIERLDVAFVAETHEGDLLNFYVLEKPEMVYDVKITKTVKGLGEEVEVCRESVKFVNK